MILVSDAVAEVSHDTHENELKTMGRIFADVKTTEEVIALLGTMGLSDNSAPIGDTGSS
jgi:isochorismate hydrolase